MTCRCGRSTRDGAFVCDHCADQLARALGDVAWLTDELETTITRQRALPAEGGSAGRETGLPWHEKASEALRGLKALLVSWARFCEEESVRHSSPRTRPLDAHDDHPTALAGWLLWRVDGLTLLDIGAEAVDEITDAVATCRRVIDRRPDRWYAGPCTHEDDGEMCGADLYARHATGTVTCRVCGSEYDVAERRAWLLAEAEDRLADASTVARAVSWLGAEPLTPDRVWKWAERGRIAVKGHHGKRPLYRIGDAIDLLAGDTTKAG